MSISVSSDVKKLTKKIQKEYKRQIPFVTSRALNACAFDARKAIQASLPQYIDRPTPYTTKSVQVKKGDKKNLKAWVGFASRTFGKLPGTAVVPPAEYMARLIKGGTRKARTKYIAVPQNTSQLTKYGGLKRGGVNKLLGNKKKYFLGVPKGHEGWGLGVWARGGRGGRGFIKKVIRFEKQTKYEKQYPFEKIAMKAIKRSFPKEFKKAFEQATRPRK